MPHRCPVCGGLFDFASPITYAPPSGPTRRRTGLARYRASLPVPPGGPLVSLGEGGTPLIPIRVGGEPVYLKCEHLNPTGSFKDRGTAVLVSALAAVGVDRAVEDSSGNAGASLAAYAARAGIRVKIYIPASAAGVKREQIRAYGAEVVPVPGPRSQVTETLLREAEEGVAYASHATLPHSLAGMATLAFELVEQLGQAPGSLIMPVGQGTLLLGAHLGFQAMVRAGVIERGPQLIGVQARRCAPIWAAYTGGASGLALVREGETAAEGVRILVPLRGDAVMEAVRASGGWMEAVEEEDIWIGVEVLAGRGFLVEPTSAVVWPAIEAALGRARAPLVAVLTGSGYKDLRRWTTGRDDRAGPDR